MLRLFDNVQCCGQLSVENAEVLQTISTEISLNIFTCLIFTVCLNHIIHSRLK